MKSAFVLMLVCSTVSFAAPLLTEPLAELHLASGKVLYQAQAKGFLARSVLVKHSGGAETVAYEEFPAEYRTQLTAKRPAPSAAPTVPQPSRPVATSAVKSLPVASPKPASQTLTATDVTSTVSLITSRMGTAFATVELHNSANQPAEVHCSAIQAETSTGDLLKGRQWVAAETPNMISSMLGTKQIIAENTSAALNVLFDPLPQGATITQVVFRPSMK